MKVGIIGSGDVGRALAKGFFETGYSTMISTRDLKKKELSDLSPEIQIGNFEGTAKFGEILVLAVSWANIESAFELSKFDNFKNKIVLDVTNPLDFSEGAEPKMALAYPNSAGKQIQEWLPGSKVVKVWNVITNANMYKPHFTEGVPVMPICGNDDEAKSFVKEILNKFGWTDVIDMGSIDQSYLLEAFAMLWIKYAFINNTWTHGFSLLRK